MFNGSGCSVGRGSYAGEREGDCSATAPARRRAKATMAVCVLVALSSQPQPFLPSALPPPLPPLPHPSQPPMGASPISTSVLPNASREAPVRHTRLARSRERFEAHGAPQSSFIG
jgi:hypothetical protein